MKLLQISDTHLYAEPHAALKGVDVDAALERVLGHLLHHHGDADLLLVTGDLSQDESEAAYHRLGERLAALPLPVHCLTGNHDRPELARRVLAGYGIGVNGRVEVGGWQVVLLDSTVAGEVGGRLGEAELGRLEALLTKRPGQPALVALHHPPVALGTPWMDAIGLADGAALLERLRGHPQVRAVLFGHAHQEFDSLRDGLRLLCVPSTCLQFAAGGEEMRIDDRPPGYRWLCDVPGGGVDTGVVRVP